MVLKPSEQTPHVSTLLAELIPKYMDNEAIRVVNGAIAETAKVRAVLCVVIKIVAKLATPAL